MTVADLIVSGLSSQHLDDWLPGNDNKAAIARLVSSRREWSGPGYACRVTGDGLGWWLTVAASYAARRLDAVLFVTWTEALAVIARGCRDGFRERYEAAYDAWGTANRDAQESFRTRGHEPPFPWADQTAISETKAALIRHGCEQLEIQEALF